eukprot:GFUD01018683.1.p1 GENE.GFUD01018683.1~~GFUD01018683.1.p1  ORF type:complete len:874 (+),score=143.39 GFUD01018683.1:108-2729(+)
MALFNRFLTHMQRKKEVPKEISLWQQDYDLVPDNGHVRVILFRECDRKGKKLLFDSNTVERHELTGNFEEDSMELFTEVGEGVGYKYLQPPYKDVKIISEMIFGSAAVAYSSSNMKIHQLENSSQIMWSSVVQAPRITRGVKASDQSLGSSFGCSFGSFQSDVFAAPIFQADDLQHASSTSGSDSGCYSSYASYANQTSFHSFPTVDSEVAIIVPCQRRLSSNADMPDYGSLCSLQRRWLSMVENSLSPNEFSSPSLPDTAQTPMQFAISPGVTSENFSKHSKSGLIYHGDNLKSGGRNAVLGLAIIIQPPDEAAHKLLFKRNLILEDIYNELLQSVQQAYIHKKRFVATVYAGYQDCVRAVNKIYTISHLRSPAWHLCTQKDDTILQEKLVADICHLKRTMDTKETNFFFSALLTGVLSHHLGWVETVMPSSGIGDNFLNKPRVVGMEEFAKENWYSPTRIQFRELHGMLGCPVRNAKTLILTGQEETARKFIFVLSYFIRCSQIFEQELKFQDNNAETQSYSIKKKDIAPSDGSVNQSLPTLDESQSSQTTTLAKSSSSPVMEKSLNFPKMKKSHSYICSLGDLDKANTDNNHKVSNEKVNFLIGENEDLNIKTEFIEEQFDSGLDVEEDINEGIINRLTLQNSQDVIITKAVTVTMKNEPYSGDSLDDPKEDECINITEVPYTSPELTESSPAPLPSLICCSDSYMPGTVLQGCFKQTSESWKTHLQTDLLATASNNFVASMTEESICVVGDATTKEVSLVSAQQVVVGRSGLPVPMSPLVASVLDTFVSTAEFNLPASVVLNQLEDNLQQLYLQSCILAEYLLTAEDFINLQSIASILDLDPCDIPLLLAVASTHTPLVGQKYGLSFIG